MGPPPPSKSTLMKCMAGSCKMDEGEIEYEGEKVVIANPLRDHSGPCQNVYKDTDDSVEEAASEIDSPRKLGSLSIAQMQMVEIAKAVSQPQGADPGRAHVVPDRQRSRVLFRIMWS